MLQGKLYKASDPALSKELQHAKDSLFDLANLRPSERAKQKEGLQSLLGSTGEHFHIEFPFYCDYGYNIQIGENFYANHQLIILDAAPVKMGDNILIGPSVGIYTSGHPLDSNQRAEGLEFALPITVGDNVWIGGHVVINPGVRIGDNVVIGSGSVVTKDIPGNCIAVGNPCRVLREITAADKERYFANRQQLDS